MVIAVNSYGYFMLFQCMSHVIAICGCSCRYGIQIVPLRRVLALASRHSKSKVRAS